ncbi:tetratricopeptide repeat protein [Novosphingobium sp. KACC 22771]|uniref:tetratricopeptide repeat protein n=1 Tax=Novosphingobium sp. KACC 22771 TaxID=3025670 RepID=UPI00236524C7|nr:tetratricopeptide repeat protein [Novosphingobium sp. KACC 22771]WDF73730.1 tetratricopeptide repeat protein [Novosphingobium sp. KACC 22771]
MALRPTPPQTRAQQLAAQQAQQGDAFLREVDDALREDQMMTAVRRYAKPVGAGLVLGLAALGGYLWWGHYQDQQAATRAEQLTIALDQIEASRTDLANKTLDGLAAGGNTGSAVVARLVEAGLLAGQGKAQDAATRYAAVAADANAPQPYRDFATLRQVSLNYDQMKPDEVIAKLKPLAAPGAPWFGAAGELLGLAYLKQGKKELASPLFGAIAKDKDQPESLRARVRQVASQLGFDAMDDVARPIELNAPQPGSAPVQAPPVAAAPEAPTAAPAPAAKSAPAKAKAATPQIPLMVGKPGAATPAAPATTQP